MVKVFTLPSKRRVNTNGLYMQTALSNLSYVVSEVVDLSRFSDPLLTAGPLLSLCKNSQVQKGLFAHLTSYRLQTPKMTSG